MITYRKKKRVFLNSQKTDLSPRVVNKRVVTEERPFNNQEVERTYDVLEIELACLIDQRVILDENITDIKVFTSNKTLGEMRQRRNFIIESQEPSGKRDQRSSNYDRYKKNKRNRRKETEGQKARRQRNEKESANQLPEFKKRANIINVVYDIDNLNQFATNSRTSGLRFLTKFDVNQILAGIKIKNIQGFKQTDEELFGSKNVFKLERAREKKARRTRKSAQNISLNVSIKNLSPSNLVNFKSIYLRQVKLGKDPLADFSYTDDSMTLEDRIRGTKKISKKPYSASRELFRAYISNRLNAAPEEDLGFNVLKEKESNRNRVVKTTFEMSRPKIRSLSIETGFLNLIFFAFDRQGRRVDSFEKRVGLQDLFLTEENPILDFEASAVRINRGDIVTKITNQEVQDAHFNLYSKVFSRSQNYFDATFSEENEDFTIRAKNTTKLFDGKTRQNSRPGIPKTKTVFHRVTSNFGEKEIFNTKSASVASLVSEGGELSCSVYVLQDSDEKSADVTISNLSEDVYAVLPVKRKVKGSRGNDFKPVRFLLEGNLVENQKVFVRNDETTEGEKSFTFVDSDVEDDVVYEYTAFLYTRSGSKQLSGSRFLEKRVDRENLINADVSSTATNITTFDERSNQIKTQIDFQVTLNRQEDDVDKIINSIFGDNRSLFNDDLSSIRDAANLLYGVRVHRIDLKTGEYVFVGSFRGFKQQSPADSASTDIPKVYNVKFSDNAPSLSTQIYKIDPYVIPPSQILDKVFTTLEREVKKKNNSRSTLNRFLVSKQKIVNRDVISEIGTKYASPLGKRGAIASKEAFLEKNRGDLFLEGVTGDIVYESVNTLLSNTNTQDLEILKKRINLLKTLDREPQALKYIPKQLASISFNSKKSDILMDFYVVVKQFNKDPNYIIDGAIHSIDLQEDTSEEITYNYLSELKTSVGLVRYYLFGIRKTGDISGPAFLGSVFLEGE